MSRKRIVPVADEPIPGDLLDQRLDATWEQESSDTRIALAMDWAAPRLEQVQRMGLLGLTVLDDDEFSELVDELYDGVRDRLTRQDLIRALMLVMGKRTIEESSTMASKAKQDLRALDLPGAVDRFFRN